MHGVDGEWQAKGVCDITLDDLAAHSDGVQLIAVPPDELTSFSAGFRRMKQALPTLKHIAASYLYRGAPERRPLQDVMTCILHKTTIQKAGFLLDANAERHLKSPEQMKVLFANWPHAIRAARAVADKCNFDLRELSYEYPKETVPEGRSPQEYLTELTYEGAKWRYPDGVPEKVSTAIRKELAMIEKLDIPQYFLTIHQIVNFAV